MEKNYFAELNGVNVNEHTEQKNGLTYLSWAWAWSEVKSRFPDATYTIYENESGWNYHTDGRTAWVKTGVTVNGIEHIEYLPVLDFKNKSIALENITSFDVNKTIQRSLTKAVARHGLGLYIYVGEDLPDDGEEAPAQTENKPAPGIYFCQNCGKALLPKRHNGVDYTPQQQAEGTENKYGKVLCWSCAAGAAAELKEKEN